MLCENGPLAVRTAKEIAVRTWNHEPAFVLENLMFQRVRNSEDATEGPRAYMEKRTPRFKGR
jgi:enoyl-CoA hydratase